MQVIFSKDFLSGAMFVLIGALGMVLGADYRVGTAARMGPGYFPQLLCWGLFAVGGFLISRSLIIAADRVEAGKWRPLVMITLAFIAFGLLAERTGLVISLALLIGIGAWAGAEARWKEVALLAVALIGFCVAAFLWGLGLPLTALPR